MAARSRLPHARLQQDLARDALLRWLLHAVDCLGDDCYQNPSSIHCRLQYLRKSLLRTPMHSSNLRTLATAPAPVLLLKGVERGCLQGGAFRVVRSCRPNKGAVPVPNAVGGLGRLPAGCQGSRSRPPPAALCTSVRYSCLFAPGLLAAARLLEAGHTDWCID